VIALDEAISEFPFADAVQKIKPNNGQTGFFVSILQLYHARLKDKSDTLKMAAACVFANKAK